MSIDDRELSQNTFSPTCDRCIHRNMLYDDYRKCKAFGGLIPLAIWLGRNPHTEPIPGDNGLRFTLKPKTG